MDIDKIIKRNKSLEGIVESFEKNTTYKVVKVGQGEVHSVNCKKGLFGVSGPTKEQAMKEARHYFVQYFEDGEYTKEA